MFVVTVLAAQASGLAAGKGVVLPQSVEEATAAVWAMLVDGSLGSAGREVVVERFLQGEEVSVLAFCDGITAVGMPPAQVQYYYYDYLTNPNPNPRRTTSAPRTATAGLTLAAWEPTRPRLSSPPSSTHSAWTSCR